MKLLSSILTLLITSAPALAWGGQTPAQSPAAAPATPAPVAAPAPVAPVELQTERTAAAAKDVLVELALESGDVVVHGWDRDEVRARTDEAPRIELRKYETAAAGGAAAKDAPARRVEVFVLHSEDAEVRPGESSGSGNVELNVPRGATVFIKVQSGDIEISDVAEARVESASGDIDLTGVSKGAEVVALSGDITVGDSRGSVRLRSLSGMVEATRLRPNDARDSFSVQSISGDIRLEDVTHAKVEGVTTSGSVGFSGALAPRGGYRLQTTSGDVTMRLPASSSFRVNARVILGGEIISDFVVKTTAPQNPDRPLSRLDGTVGTGDAEISLMSHNGTVHLRKN
jgi:hypothetical protein